MVKKNACIFISGNGTNLRSIILKSREYNFPANVKLVVSNRENALGLNYAKKWSIPIFILRKNPISEIILLKALKEKKIDIIILAGYMKILSKKFIRAFDKLIINIHPSLLPKYRGLDTFARILKANEKKTGCTVHYVNEKLDEGKIILRKFFFIKKKDTINSLKTKTHNLEYRAYSEAIYKTLSGL